MDQNGKGIIAAMIVCCVVVCGFINAKLTPAVAPVTPAVVAPVIPGPTPSVVPPSPAPTPAPNPAVDPLKAQYRDAVVKAIANGFRAGATQPWTTSNQSRKVNTDAFNQGLLDANNATIAPDLLKRFGPPTDAPMSATDAAALRQYYADLADAIDGGQ